MQIRFLEIGARHRQHLARQIDTDRALDARRDDLEHAAGAGAEIKQIADSVTAKRFEDRRLNLALVDMKRANLVPLLGIGAEIGVGGFGALALHRVEPRLVERDCRIVTRHGGANLPRQIGGAAARRQPIMDPGPLAEPVEQPGIAQQLQMARNPRLALAEDVGELGHCQLALGAEQQQPQPG